LAFAIPAAAADLVCDALKLSFPEDAQLQGSVALVVGVVGTLAMTRLLVLASRGAPLRAGEALLFALRRWPAAVALTFITELIISLGLLLLVVPGVVAALNLSLALPLLAATRLDANQAMRRSKALVAGERRRLFWPLLLSFVATALPGQLLAMLPAILSASAPSLAAPVPAALIAFATEAIAGLLGGFFLAVLVACFAKIARRGDVALQGLGNQLA
jgi:uncharacterized membrane-anchored protein